MLPLLPHGGAGTRSRRMYEHAEEGAGQKIGRERLGRAGGVCREPLRCGRIERGVLRDLPCFKSIFATESSGRSSLITPNRLDERACAIDFVQEDCEAVSGLCQTDF